MTPTEPNRPRSEPAGAGNEFYFALRRPARGIDLRQYVYEIGSYHYNWHPELELLVILSGSVEVCAGGRVTAHEPGDVIVINSGVGHATLAHSPNSWAMLIHLDLGYFADLYEDHGRLRFDCVSDASTRGKPSFVTLRGVLAQMMLESADTSPAGLLRYERHLLELVDTLVTYFPPTIEEQTAALGRENRIRAIDRMLDFVDTHYAERITLERLGKESGYHPGYVSQMFARYLGVGTIEYITRVRLRQATRDLCDPDMKVVDVAANNGFPDVKAFNVAFRRTFGKSPTQYRRQLTEDSSAADATFKKVFAKRDDPETAAWLRALASAVAPGAERSPSEPVDWPTDDVRVLVGEARRLADDLQRIQHRLERLAGGLG